MTLPRGARLPIAFLAVALLCVWARLLDLPALSGPIKGDEATYASMALSLAKDHDLKYRPEDYQRFVAYFHQGPEGIFLKRDHRSASPVIEQLDYGKAFAYAVCAAPFAAVAGPGGLIAFNIVLLAVCIWCAVLFCRARAGPLGGTILGVAFIMASVVPVYAVWMTSELFNVTLVLGAFFVWLYPEVATKAPAWLRQGNRAAVIAAVLLATATFSKPTNGLLVAPMVLTLFLRRRWRDGLVAALVFVGVTSAWFWTNRVISGDWNYQGGDRKYFVTHFPFDGTGTAFESQTSGNQMATNEANDENILAPDYMFPMLRYNIGYFLVGRDAGLVPYFFPGVVIAVWWLVRLRRSTLWQWLTAIACAGSVLALLILTPSSWNGGGGPVGNRYFLSIYPTLLFLLPAGGGLIAAVATAVVGLTFVGAILVRPFAASQSTWLNPERWPLRLLPVELTLMNDLPVYLNILRGKVMVSRDPEVFLYYMDSRTYNQEPGGFWVAPGTTDIVIRTEHVLTKLTLKIESQIPNEVEVSIGGRSDRVSIQPGEEPTLRFTPPPGVHANGYEIVLTIKTKSGFYPQQFDPKSQDKRYLGAFIKPTYEVK